MNLQFQVEHRKEKYMIYTRVLTYSDLEMVSWLDEQSGNHVSEWLDDKDYYVRDYAYGIFLNDLLVGYCTIGGADCQQGIIGEHEDYNQYTYLLSDVFISPEYRKYGFGSELIKEAIRLKKAVEGDNTVYIVIMEEKLFHFYNPIGFKWCKGNNIIDSDGAMFLH